jgi:two-component system, NarL family, invasion response regulator UvrY
MFKIIIADDHPVVMQALKKIILEEFPGVYVEEATDTSSLLEKVSGNTWHLVISDLAMPGGGGFFALEKIKKSKKRLPVITLSTYPAEQYKSPILKAGAEDFISKDALPGGLIKAVKRILGTDHTPEQY